MSKSKSPGQLFDERSWIWIELKAIRHLLDVAQHLPQHSQGARHQTLLIKRSCLRLNQLHMAILCGKGRK
jgi:hypothetical protein